MSLKVKFICCRADRECPWFPLHHPNLEEYCRRHGYTYLKNLDWIESAAKVGYVRRASRDIEEVTERIVGVRKLIIEQLEGCDLLVWLGADTVVTNMNIRIEDVMPADAHVAMPKEEWYECDALMARNTPEAVSFLEDWLSWMLDANHKVWQEYGDFIPPFAIAQQRQIPEGGTFAQSMLVENHFGEAKLPLLLHDDIVLTAVCDRYPEHAARVHTFDRKGFVVKHVHWQKGDFIMHVPGSPDQDRVDFMKLGLANIVRDDAIPTRTDDIGAFLRCRNLLGKGAEVGVATGGIGVTLLEWGIETVYFVDAWATGNAPGDASSPQEWHDANFLRFSERIEQYGDRAIVLRGDSAEQAANVPDGSLDFCYIDACHFYNWVKWDLEAWWPKVRSGGILAGHDYLNPGYDVQRAVNEFSASHGLTVHILDADKIDNASFLLEK